MRDPQASPYAFLVSKQIEFVNKIVNLFQIFAEKDDLLSSGSKSGVSEYWVTKLTKYTEQALEMEAKNYRYVTFV